MSDIRIGIIGLDSSHAVAFTKLINNTSEKYHVPGGKVVLAYPGGSPEIELSQSRIGRFTAELQTGCNVKIVHSIEEVVQGSDAILLESMDGSVHLEQFRQVVSYQKPVFIDKPLSLSTESAKEMMRLAFEHNTPVMSSSALRFAESVTNVLKTTSKGKITGADCFGPLEMLEEQPGYFWYGIHLIELLVTILGGDVKSVTVHAETDQDVVVSRWADGRVGTMRGIRSGDTQFGGVIHFENGSEYFIVDSSDRPFYSSLLGEVMNFFQDGISRVPVNETVAVIRMIEAANKSMTRGETVFLERKAEVKGEFTSG